MNQNDVESGGDFEDELAYGGWSMVTTTRLVSHTRGTYDLSSSATPYGIPFRCLYSKGVPNLLFAGRNISVSHAALSSCRVMGTCALLGQAAGTAASLAITEQCFPKDFSKEQIVRLQHILMDDDCFLPHFKRPISALSASASLSGDGNNLECLRDGIDRDRPNVCHAWEGKVGDRIQYSFSKPCNIHRIRIVFDSDLNRTTLPPPENTMNRNMFHNRMLSYKPSTVPKTMLRKYRVIAQRSDGTGAMCDGRAE